VSVIEKLTMMCVGEI